MLIQLGGYFSPERIVKAFLSALPTTKYSEWFYETVQTTCIEGDRTTRCTGIRSHLIHKRKSFWFFGDEVIEVGNLHFSLSPLPDDYPHSEADITPIFEYQLNKEGSIAYTCDDPNDSNFKKALPIWNNFLKEFQKQLIRLP